MSDTPYLQSKDGTKIIMPQGWGEIQWQPDMLTLSDSAAFVFHGTTEDLIAVIARHLNAAGNSCVQSDIFQRSIGAIPTDPIGCHKASVSIVRDLVANPSPSHAARARALQLKIVLTIS